MQKSTSERKARSSRRAWLVCAAWLTAGLAQAGISRPADRKNPALKAAPTTHCLVSAISRESAQDLTFRLLHSAQSTSSADEATGLSTRMAMEKFPGRAVAQTVVTKLSPPPGACPGDKRAAPTTAARTIYAVSALMRQGDDNFDTLLLNGWLPGLNASDALNRVLRDATAQYPLHTPISTLVTELGVARPACSAMSPKRGQWQAV
jgi:hypothetical protein